MTPGGVKDKIKKAALLKRAVRNWPVTLLDHLGYRAGEYVCLLRNGLSFHVRPHTDDRHVIFEMFAQQIYPAVITTDDIVVDIGAHIGSFTIWAASQGAQVISFEPFPDNFTILRQNVLRNKLTSVSLHQTGVAGIRETRTMYLPKATDHTGRYSLHPGRGYETIMVPCVTLDDVFTDNSLPRIDLLKIDCQGSEYEILYSASTEILTRIKRIIVECEAFTDHSEWSAHALASYLQSAGYTVTTQANLVFAQRPV